MSEVDSKESRKGNKGSKYKYLKGLLLSKGREEEELKEEVR